MFCTEDTARAKQNIVKIRLRISFADMYCFGEGFPSLFEIGDLLKSSCSVTTYTSWASTLSVGNDGMSISLGSRARYSYSENAI
jgi:hypothetical protein